MAGKRRVSVIRDLYDLKMKIARAKLRVGRHYQIPNNMWRSGKEMAVQIVSST